MAPKKVEDVGKPEEEEVEEPEEGEEVKDEEGEGDEVRLLRRARIRDYGY